MGVRYFESLVALLVGGPHLVPSLAWGVPPACLSSRWSPIGASVSPDHQLIIVTGSRCHAPAFSRASASTARALLKLTSFQRYARSTATSRGHPVETRIQRSCRQVHPLVPHRSGCEVPAHGQRRMAPDANQLPSRRTLLPFLWRSSRHLRLQSNMPPLRRAVPTQPPSSRRSRVHPQLHQVRHLVQ